MKELKEAVQKEVFNRIIVYVHEIMGKTLKQLGVIGVSLSAPVIMGDFFNKATNFPFESKVITGHIKLTRGVEVSYIRHIWCETMGTNVEAKFLKTNDVDITIEIVDTIPSNIQEQIVEIHESKVSGISPKEVLKKYTDGTPTDEMLKFYNTLYDKFSYNINLYAAGIFSQESDQIRVMYEGYIAIILFKNALTRTVDKTVFEYEPPI